MDMRRYLAAAIPILLFCLTSGAMAQMSGSGKMISPGMIVAGGGQSTGGSKTITGYVPLSSAGISSGNADYCFGGVMAAGFGAVPLSLSYNAGARLLVSKRDTTLIVIVNGGAGEISGSFFHRFWGQTTYQAADITVTGDTVSYSLPDSLITVRGLAYYFSISRGGSNGTVGSSGSPDTIVSFLTNAEAQRPTPLTASKYHIVSVPVAISGSNAVTSVFGDDLGDKDITKWRLGSYSAALDSVLEYPNSALVTPRQAFWLIEKAPTSYGAAGLSREPNASHNNVGYFMVPLDTGWNQLANPLPFAVNWADVIIDTNSIMIQNGHPASVLEDHAYWYNGAAYVDLDSTSIPAWDGIFVYVIHPNADARFPLIEATSPTFKPLSTLAGNPTPNDWSIHLQLEANGLVDDGNFAGVKATAVDGADNFDLSEPPPAPGAAYAAFRLPDGDHRLRRCDFRAPFSDGAEWDISLSPAARRTITATGITGIPAGMGAVLKWDDGTVVQLREGQQIAVPEKSSSAQLIVGTDEYLSGQQVAVPGMYALLQNYPNPFNPSTTIRFAIPSASRVQMTVYNIIGQRVKTLVDEDRAAGEYVVEWNGNDENGQPVASGIYFYRLKSGSFDQTHKMTLLK